MSKSPGHREHPEHKVLKKRLQERIRATLDRGSTEAVSGATAAELRA